jgi:hypothetical protein
MWFRRLNQSQYGYVILIYDLINITIFQFFCDEMALLMFRRLLLQRLSNPIRRFSTVPNDPFPSSEMCCGNGCTNCVLNDYFENLMVQTANGQPQQLAEAKKENLEQAGHVGIDNSSISKAPRASSVNQVV